MYSIGNLGDVIHRYGILHRNDEIFQMMLTEWFGENGSNVPFLVNPIFMRFDSIRFNWGVIMRVFNKE